MKNTPKVAENGHFGSRTPRYLVSTRIFKALCYGVRPFLLRILGPLLFVQLPTRSETSQSFTHSWCPWVFFHSIHAWHGMGWAMLSQPQGSRCGLGLSPMSRLVGLGTHSKRASFLQELNLMLCIFLDENTPAS